LFVSCKQIDIYGFLTLKKMLKLLVGIQQVLKSILATFAVLSFTCVGETDETVSACELIGLSLR